VKQSRLFPPALIPFIAFVIISASQSIAVEVSWSDINSLENGYYDSPYHWGDYPLIPISGFDEFIAVDTILAIDSLDLVGVPGTFHVQSPSHDILIYEIFHAMPEELLTLQINSQPLISNQPSMWNNDMQSDYEPADHIVFNNNADYIKSMRIPSPSSLLLVAIGLLSLRYTRSFRL